MHTDTYMQVYIHIQRERERASERTNQWKFEVNEDHKSSTKVCIGSPQGFQDLLPTEAQHALSQCLEQLVRAAELA